VLGLRTKMRDYATASDFQEALSALMSKGGKTFLPVWIVLVYIGRLNPLHQGF
jgi:hypothetical protein